MFFEPNLGISANNPSCFDTPKPVRLGDAARHERGERACACHVTRGPRACEIRKPRLTYTRRGRRAVTRARRARPNVGGSRNGWRRLDAVVRAVARAVVRAVVEISSAGD